MKIMAVSETKVRMIKHVFLSSFALELGHVVFLLTCLVLLILVSFGVSATSFFALVFDIYYQLKL